MPNFDYVARNHSGDRIAGSMVAATERDVINNLTKKSLFPVSIESETTSAPLQFGRGISQQKIATFYSQLASLLKNGVPLIKSLHVLREQTSSNALRNALDDIIARIEDGEPIGDTFAKHPRLFSEMAVNMARAGTEGGFLEDALDRVAMFTEQQAELKSRTIGSLIYPLVLATVGTLVVTALLIFVVPQFDVMFQTLRDQGQLPRMTDLLLGFSAFLKSYWWIIALALVITTFAVRVQLRTEAGRIVADRLKLKIPMFGPIFQNLAVARFCRVLGTLLKNGVPILKALDIGREAAGNRVISTAIGSATENITAGQSLSIPLAKSGRFPKTVTEMISVAEESNTLDVVLVNIADGLEKETSRRLDLMVKMLEPIMLMIMAVVVLCVVIALLMPIMKMGVVFQE